MSYVYEIRIPNIDKNMQLIDDNRVGNAREETIAFLLQWASGCEARITLGYYKGTKGKLFMEQTSVISSHVKDKYESHVDAAIRLHCQDLARALNQQCIMWSKSSSTMKLVFPEASNV
tara:strand:- start:20415 stop:20768 length:354 start_codon:yes stop_codon:yes gene_type:complete